MSSNYYIGTTLGNLTDVTSLSGDAIAPIGDFQRWIASEILGNGLVRALGRPVATWYWCYITPALRTALMVYCPGKSARVFIRTEDDPNLHTTEVYEAAMVWPDTDMLYNQDEFRITFRDLVWQGIT